MDENEILSRLDARGRAAAAGTHAAVADVPVPAFDPEVVVVPLDAARPGRRWLALVGIAATLVVLVGAVVLLAGGGDDDAPVVDSGSVRRYVATHLPEGFVPSFLSSSSGGEAGSMPAQLYGPSPTEARAGVGIAPEEVAADVDFEPEGRPEWEATTFGGRDGFVMTDDELLGWYGLLVVVDGTEVTIFGAEEDRPALERIAATVELAGGAVVADSPELPDGWEGQGRVDDLLGAFAPGGPYEYGAGHLISYGGAMQRSGSGAFMHSVSIASRPGGVPDVASIVLLPWAERTRTDVIVRGHPAVLVGVLGEAAEVLGSEVWTVAWVERPGEVVVVSGTGVGRDEVLAVAESVRPVEEGEWERLERESLRGPLRSSEGEVVLGEGSFSDGSPWLLVVDPDGYDDGPEPDGSSDGDSTSSGSVGAPIEPGGSGSAPEPTIELRTTAGASSGSSSGTSGSMASPDGEEPFMAFLGSVSAVGGGPFGWVYGLVAPEVATVELVGADGEVLVTAEVLSTEGFHGWVLELPPELSIEPEGPPEQDLGDGDDDFAIGSTEVPATTVVATGPDRGLDGPVLVARAADGTELGRQALP